MTVRVERHQNGHSFSETFELRDPFAYLYGAPCDVSLILDGIVHFVLTVEIVSD